ncbi:MAG: hypothetical protein A3I68_02025 [Candidatus Melainabacteria bacterium RIFCSPLOWO2_02_FULL_35_15]|nr:MAG: hypothetical protein A3F80_01725 [Candidatus Melainabacteria bacterium RIFCSPLOWO2_12_FULL_35_11]OGI13842.1 MAG: hypothetical protein A3I68_02025 [Candidatus Melainabacteria bacterium RIFCSPLOWO2_02_FULL_35_15]
MTKHIVKLNPKEKKFLKSILLAGKHPARVIMRTQILLKANRGLTDKDIAEHVECHERTARDIRKKFCTSGLEKTIYDVPHTWSRKTFTDEVNSRIVAIACTDPPKGASHWRLELLCQEAIKQKIVKTVSKQQMSLILRGHNLKPWRKKNVVRSKVN